MAALGWLLNLGFAGTATEDEVVYGGGGATKAEVYSAGGVACESFSGGAVKAEAYDAKQIAGEVY